MKRRSLASLDSAVSDGKSVTWAAAPLLYKLHCLFLVLYHLVSSYRRLGISLVKEQSLPAARYTSATISRLHLATIALGMELVRQRIVISHSPSGLE